MTSDSEILAENAAAAVTSVVPVVGGGELQSLGLSMLAVVLTIVVLGWLYSRSRFVSGGASDTINVLATRALGPKERLLVIEVADQQLLVGMTSTAVQTLHVFDKPLDIGAARTSPLGFKGRLSKALQEFGQ